MCSKSQYKCFKQKNVFVVECQILSCICERVLSWVFAFPQTYVRKCKQTGLLVSLVTSDVFSSPNLFCVLTDCTIPLRVAMPPTLPFYCSEIYFLFPKSSSCNLTSCGPGGDSCRFRKPQTPLFLSRVQGILSASDLFLLRVQLFKVI